MKDTRLLGYRFFRFQRAAKSSRMVVRVSANGSFERPHVRSALVTQYSVPLSSTSHQLLYVRKTYVYSPISISSAASSCFLRLRINISDCALCDLHSTAYLRLSAFCGVWDHAMQQMGGGM
jgi:hypothetical protein